MSLGNEIKKMDRINIFRWLHLDYDLITVVDLTIQP